MLHTLVPFRLLIKLGRAAGLIDEIRYSNFQLVMDNEVCNHMSAFPDHYSRKKKCTFSYDELFTHSVYSCLLSKLNWYYFSIAWQLV